MLTIEIILLWPYQLKLKVGKSEKKLMKLDSEWISSRDSTDQELLTEEERQNFQKIGSKMTELLVLGELYSAFCSPIIYVSCLVGKSLQLLYEA